MLHICAKGILDLNLNEAVIDNITFYEIAPNFTYLQKKKKYNWIFLDQLLLRYKFYGWDM